MNNFTFRKGKQTQQTSTLWLRHCSGSGSAEAARIGGIQLQWTTHSIGLPQDNTTEQEVLAAL
jgi:hypothetical protein